MAQGKADQGPGPNARAKRALDSSVYIYIYNISSPENNDTTKLVISIRAGGKPLAGRITNFVLIIFQASYVIYLYIIHWLLHIHCLSLLAYICPMPPTIGVYSSNACPHRHIFVQCQSLKAHICSMPVGNH